MKLYYHRNKLGVPNFGDDLNPWLWQQLIAEELDDDGDTMFLGIGTLLNDRLPPARGRVVFGTGYGIGGPPAVTAAWTIYAVRGPISASRLGLGPDYAVTDPAILVSRFVPPADGLTRFAFSYMPHYRNACESWRRACERVGFGYIDPRRPLAEVFEAIRTTGVLLAEAMHGAIVADTLRVPWIPIRSRGKVLSLKWEDWCSSMELAYRPTTIVPLWDGESRVDKARAAVKTWVASFQLQRAARSTPRLSGDATFFRKRQRLEQLLDQFRRDVKRGRFAPAARRDVMTIGPTLVEGGCRCVPTSGEN